jgi:hypothetical protein
VSNSDDSELPGPDVLRSSAEAVDKVSHQRRQAIVLALQPVVLDRRASSAPGH